eukprot:TRINITY_DN327_c0_g1_i2.p2 TRINITY_DN327_c0_g1~~TRINITY_DN327_c0_g1_i2.p2  ORF type:complete len:100 (-),score=29.94 TRINITY_DN327_c0_g1_i2:466-720(-)
MIEDGNLSDGLTSDFTTDVGSASEAPSESDVENISSRTKANGVRQPLVSQPIAHTGTNSFAVSQKSKSSKIPRENNVIPIFTSS